MLKKPRAARNIQNNNQKINVSTVYPQIVEVNKVNQYHSVN